jgi:hypothetical protein
VAGLGDQHPVERIAVERRQVPRLERVRRAHGQYREAGSGDRRLQSVERQGELAEAGLDRDLPDRDRADVDDPAQIADAGACPQRGCESP